MDDLYGTRYRKQRGISKLVRVSAADSSSFSQIGQTGQTAGIGRTSGAGQTTLFAGAASAGARAAGKGGAGAAGGGAAKGTRATRERIGGVLYEREAGGHSMVRVRESKRLDLKRDRARAVLSAARDKRREERVNKSKTLCTFFTRLGKCAREKCAFLHDKERVAVCRLFLKGQCASEGCPFSHSAAPERMPACLHFLAGTCLKGDECAYRHIKVAADSTQDPLLLPRPAKRPRGGSASALQGRPASGRGGPASGYMDGPASGQKVATSGFLDQEFKAHRHMDGPASGPSPPRTTGPVRTQNPGKASGVVSRTLGDNTGVVSGCLPGAVSRTLGSGGTPAPSSNPALLAPSGSSGTQDVRLPGKGNSNSHGARPVHLGASGKTPGAHQRMAPTAEHALPPGSAQGGVQARLGTGPTSNPGLPPQSGATHPGRALGLFAAGAAARGGMSLQGEGAGALSAARGAAPQPLGSRNPKPPTPNPKPYTLNPKP